MMLAPIPAQSYEGLKKIEAHWANAGRGGVKPQFVWKELRKLSEGIRAPLSDHEVGALLRADVCVGCSNFPLGLVSLGAGLGPLQSLVPIAQRPLTPLTMALQLELTAPGRLYLFNSLRVLILECTDAGDVVGRACRDAWRDAMKILGTSPRTNVEYMEVSSSEELVKLLAETDAHVVVISAHGAIQDRVATLRVGQENVNPAQLSRVPPFVILSACDAMARGRTSITFGDMLLLRGALAVLGPLVQVNARHNAALILQLLFEMAAAMRGEIEVATLAHLWLRVQRKAPLFDAIYGNGVLEDWLLDREAGLSVIERFAERLAAAGHDTPDIHGTARTALGKMAKERGDLARVASALESQAYAPESLMYTLAGWPELVVLHDKHWEAVAPLASE